MKPNRFLFVNAALVCGLAGGLPAQMKIDKVAVQPTSASDGAEMYQAYCASCHGLDGKGDGPAATATKIPPTNLTTMAKYNRGEFPTLMVMTTLAQARRVHGSADMPVWGDVFRTLAGGDALVALRIHNITSYLESIQEPSEKMEKPVKEERLQVQDIPASSGAAMYHAYCASCHGADGRGNGPSAVSLKTPPSDLTQLARNNNAKFPALKVGEVLGKRPGTLAHGSAEMPVWGNVFRARERDQSLATLRIANLIRYLEAMQR